MSKTILIVEDERKMRVLLADYLLHEGYAVLEAANGQEALNMFARHRIDLILLDIMMPGLDGLHVCAQVRAKSNVIILLLTARSEEYDKLQGYELGADDYVTKPFSTKVLLAKIKALLKRTELTAMPQTADRIRLDGLEIDPLSHEVWLDEAPLQLSPKEYELLLHLYRNKNITLARDTLLDQLWGFDYEGDNRTVDTHIKRLRQKLAHKAALIVTVKGFGYKLQVKR